jgi:hypothetical protein
MADKFYHKAAKVRSALRKVMAENLSAILSHYSFMRALRGTAYGM